MCHNLTTRGGILTVVIIVLLRPISAAAPDTAESAGIDLLGGFCSPFIISSVCLDALIGKDSGRTAPQKVGRLKGESQTLSDKKFWSIGEVGQSEYIDLTGEISSFNFGQRVTSALLSPYLGGVFIGAASLAAFPVTVPYSVHRAGIHALRKKPFWSALLGSILGIALSYSSEREFSYFNAYCNSVIGSVVFYNILPATSSDSKQEE